MSGIFGPASDEGTLFPRYDERASLSQTTASPPRQRPDDREGPAVPRAAGVAATPWSERAKLARHTEGTEFPRRSRDRRSRSLTEGASRLSNDHGIDCRRCRQPMRRSRARRLQDGVRGPWFERQPHGPSSVIPEIADRRRRRGRPIEGREASRRSGVLASEASEGSAELRSAGDRREPRSVARPTDRREGGLG